MKRAMDNHFVLVLGDFPAVAKRRELGWVRKVKDALTRASYHNSVYHHLELNNDKIQMHSDVMDELKKAAPAIIVALGQRVARALIPSGLEYVAVKHPQSMFWAEYNEHVKEQLRRFQAKQVLRALPDHA